MPGYNTCWLSLASRGLHLFSQQKCALHIDGYTERTDLRATYSSPSLVGVLMAVGNVGETLAPSTESDTFLSRDAGFTCQEVHNDGSLATLDRFSS